MLDADSIPADLEDAVCQSVTLEKDTILFLMEMQRIVLDEYSDQIDKLIDEERSHLQYLYAYLDAL